MIFTALDFVRKRLDTALTQRYPSDTGWVRLAPVTTSDGGVADQTKDKILMTLVNIERDATATRTLPALKSADLSVQKMNPTLQLSLDVLVSARFDGAYSDGLQLLTAAIDYFQGAALYTRVSAPDLPPNVDRLTCEWVDLDLQSIHNLWTVLGGRYLPSVLYKYRLIAVQSGRIIDDVPLITGVGVDGTLEHDR